MGAVRVQFLGTGGPFARGGRLQTCILIESDQGRYLIDCGMTALVAMARFGIDPGSIDMVLVTHLHGDHYGGLLLTFFRFPKAQWKTLRTTDLIERLHEEFRRRVKTQGSLPGEDAALVVLFSLVASGQIKLRRIDGWQKIATVLRQHTSLAA
jgi:metal-dependent hydrolase (beta-lactamase superfamily II)